jgi:hypothetical protein
MAEMMSQVNPELFGRLLALLERGVVALEGLDKSVKLIQEVLNNPADDVPVGMTVKPSPPSS